MKTDKTTLLRYLAVVLMLVVIAAIAELTGQNEVIFPEAGALCVGLWLMPKGVWNVRSWQIPLLLTVAATIGLIINLLLPIGFELRFLLAFIIVMLLLRTLRCNMYPVVSAAMLPVLINTTSWVYPTSVLVISLVLILVRKMLPQSERTDYHPFSITQMVRLSLVLIVPLLVTHLTQSTTLRFAIVPPLVVTMIEFANRQSGFRKRPWSIWMLIVAASGIGVAVELLLHRTWHLPMALGILIASVLMLMLFRHFKPFAPALAITMVPLLLPNEVLLWFPLLTAVGSGWFIAMGVLLNQQDVAERRATRSRKKT
ncbi:MAG: hypothetical protein Q4D03_06065 [Bacteroidales bacterium]|nr:hypothetical protein [Bacteroidales bacterium]